MISRQSKCFSILLSLLVLFSQFVCIPALASSEEPAPEGFAQAFRQPEDIASKPFMRWWIAPGRMEEELTRQQIRSFAEGGYGGIELISLELATCPMNTPEWNEVLLWIFDEADKNGLQVDVTLGEFWPIATELIAPEDVYTDPRAEKTIYIGTTDVTAEPGALTVSVDGWAYPPETQAMWFMPASSPLKQDQPYTLVAVTAARKTGDGIYDPNSAAVLTELVDGSTGALTWTAPEAGEWTVFYTYQQNTGKLLAYGVDAAVIDHLDKAASELIIESFERGFEATPELKELYRKVGGNFFGDSLELSDCTVWTGSMLEEFEARRGYDLTPYLPAIYAQNGYNDAAGSFQFDFAEIGERVRMDYGQTISELVAENHLGTIRDWAESELDMGLRYQSHLVSRTFFYDTTVASLAVSIPETESYGTGDNFDIYHTMSGVAHMDGTLYSAEAAESGMQDWRQTWTGSVTKDGSEAHDRGFMYYTNRMFASGVNKLIFHGASAKITDFEDTYFPMEPTWPGYAFMAALNYSNEWDDRTPLWENTELMTDYLSRVQLVLQQGQGDVDLAFYRLFTTASTDQAQPREITWAGYTYDYISDAILAMDGAVTGTRNGSVVLAPDGPAYRAIVLDQRRTTAASASGEASGEISEPFAMSLETAEKLCEYADAGLPVVIIGEAPELVDSYPGSTDALAAADAELQALMAELASKPNVVTIPDRAGLIDALLALGVTPDAMPDEAGTNMYYHRAAADVDYYFVANDSTTEACRQTVTFRGSGRPYLLDAWTGEIEPIAEYRGSDGAVTFEIELAPSGQMLIAVAEDGFAGSAPERHAEATDADSVRYTEDGLAVRTAEAGEYTVTMDNGEAISATAEAAEVPLNLNGQPWTMTLHAWLPLTTEHDTEDNNFLRTRIVDYGPYELTELVPWYEIDPELAHLGGVAEYSTTFTLTDGWSEGQGAYLTLADASDTVTVTVNGANVTVDQIAKTADIGPYLIAGENTLVITTASNLANYKYGTTDADTFRFGLMGDVVITPYRETEIQF